MFPTLRDFISALDRCGELRRISAPVASILEIAEIADRVSKSIAPNQGITGKTVDPEHAGLGGPALLFENVSDVESSIPVAINLFGSYRRMEMALGCHAEGRRPGGFPAIADEIAALTKPQLPTDLAHLLRQARRFLPLLRITPRRVRRGICQEVVKTGQAVNLLEIPIIKCWPLDGDPASVGFNIPPDQPDTAPGRGRFITLAGMYTIHADDRDADRPASRNAGMYRAQLIDRRHLAMHWHVHHDGALHWRSWKRIGKPMPLAIVLGGESVLPYAATAPLPPGVSELLMAGFLKKGPIRLVRCRTIPLDVPANAEIVIEGYISTEAGYPGFARAGNNENRPLGPGAVLEGPFGDHTGYYSLPDRYPIMDVTAITHRRRPVYPTTIVGLPPQEDYYLGKATERIFLPLLQTIIPDIEDYHLPIFGCFHNCVFVKITKAYPLQARRVMHAIWGAGQMAWTKIIIVVDHDIDVHQRDQVLQAMFSYCNFRRDVELVDGPLDILDHAAPRMGAGHKIGFDATRKIIGEEVNGIAIQPGHGPEAGASGPLPSKLPQWQSAISALAGVVALQSPEFGIGRCLFISTDLEDAQSVRKLLGQVLHLGSDLAGGIEFVIAVDAAVDVSDTDAVLFHLGTNVDPGRDLVKCGEGIAFDATRKKPGVDVNGEPVRDYPPIIRMSDEIRDLVTARWSDYGLDELRRP